MWHSLYDLDGQNLPVFSFRGTTLICGVLQGSVLRPLLFSLSDPFLPIIMCIFIDLLKMLRLSSPWNCKDAVLAWNSDIWTWLRLSFLNLNEKKTEVTVLGHHYSDYFDTPLAGLKKNCPAIKILGFMFERDFKLEGAFFQLLLHDPHGSRRITRFSYPLYNISHPTVFCVDVNAAC